MNVIIINFTFLLYFVSFIFAIYSAFIKRKIEDNVFRNIFLFASLLNAISIILRWYEADRPPFSNRYESMILTIFCFSMTYYFFSRYYKSKVINFLAALMALLMITYAMFYTDIRIKPLMPALKSNWLIIHVVSYMAAYGIIVLSFLLSCASVIQYIFKKGEFSKKNYFFTEENDETNMLSIDNNKYRYSKCADVGSTPLSCLNYKLISIAFPLLNLGLITGAVWSNISRGDYWSWDPKETWALICWFFYINYLHIPYSLPKIFKNMDARTLKFIESLVLILGFALILFTYLGLHLLPSGNKSLHIYSLHKFDLVFYMT